MAEPKISTIPAEFHHNKTHSSSIQDHYKTDLLKHRKEKTTIERRYEGSMEMENGRKPGRSDARLSMEDEREMEAKTREHFNGVAPKRHTKPHRSEFSAQYADKITSNDDYIPELAEFQRLESDPRERVAYDGRNANIPEEFVETKYYEDLNCVDKQHHTTGTGFIKMEDGDGKSFRLAADSATAACCHGSCKGNPATNDWIPASNDPAHLISDKAK